MPESVDYRAILGSSLGADLDADECQTLAGILQTRVLSDGEVLIEEGQKDHALQLVARGAISVERHTPDGLHHVVHVMHPGEFSGVMGFFDGAPRTATLRSSGESLIYVMERSAFETLVSEQPKIAFKVVRSVIRNAYHIIESMNRQMEQLSNYFFKHGGRY